MMIVLELTEQEALNLRNLLDAAVRAAGMQAAEFAIPLDAKIRTASAKAGAGPPSGNGDAMARPPQ